MKKLHSLALYALVTPVITLSASSLLAQQSTSQGFDPDEQSQTQHEQSSAQEQRDAQPTGRDSELGQRSSQQDQDERRSIGQDSDREERSSQQRPGAAQSGPTVTQDDDDEQRSQRPGQQSDAQSVADRMRDQDRDEKRGYLDRSPQNAQYLSNVMGASVKTSNDEDVGSVDDLIIDEDGQIVAIMVGVGGFLGMGQKDVAIGWGHVSTSGEDDDMELRIDVSRQDLRSAPEFEKRDD